MVQPGPPNPRHLAARPAMQCSRRLDSAGTAPVCNFCTLKKVFSSTLRFLLMFVILYLGPPNLEINSNCVITSYFQGYFQYVGYAKWYGRGQTLRNSYLEKCKPDNLTPLHDTLVESIVKDEIIMGIDKWSPNSNLQTRS